MDMDNMEINGIWIYMEMDIQMDEYFKEAEVNHGKQHVKNLVHMTLKKICHLTVFVVF